MAQRKQARRIWVELEVNWHGAIPFRPKAKTLYGYSIFNPRTGKPIESSPVFFDTKQKATNAGLAYLRATYNTGKSK